MAINIEFSGNYFARKGDNPDAEYIAFLEKHFLLPLGFGKHSSTNSRKLEAFCDTTIGETRIILEKEASEEDFQEVIQWNGHMKEVYVFENDNVILCDGFKVVNTDVYAISLSGKTELGLKMLAKITGEIATHLAVTRCYTGQPLVTPFDDEGEIELLLPL